MSITRSHRTTSARHREPRLRYSLFCLLILAGLWLGCSAPEEPAGDATPQPAAPQPAAPQPAAPQPAAPQPAAPPSGDSNFRFVDATEQSGVEWTHNTGAFGERWLPETIGPGVILLDFDGDEKSDLLFVNGRNFSGKPGKATTPALWRNKGGLRFVDATREAGLDFSVYCLGGMAGDIDNDGDPDVYLSCLGQDHLLRNDEGRFTDVSREAGLSQEVEFGASGVFFDADRDGYLDIYVTRYVTWSPETDIFCSFDGQVKSYCTPALFTGASPRYYRNRGDGTFEDQTQTAGFHHPEAKMLGVVALDVNRDDWPDLAVAGDTYRNLLYMNSGDGTFEEAGVLSGMSVSMQGNTQGGMGIDAGDYDRSGRHSLAVSYFSYEMVALYRNEGNDFFLDVAPSNEIGPKTFFTLGWGCFFFDYDLDGWLDFFLANGHLDDGIEKVAGTITYAQPQQLFRNVGEGRFSEVTQTAGADLARPLVGRGAAFGDLDDDGDPDIVLTTNGGPAKIYENRGEGYGNWLRLSLEGTKSNREAIGAFVELTAQGATQTWYVHTGGSYLSQSQVDPTFGLGRGTGTVERIVIHWPSGTTQTLTDVAVNQRLKVREEPG